MYTRLWNRMVDFLHMLYRRRRLILILAGLAVAAFGLAKLIGYFGDMVSSRNTDEEIRRIYYAGVTETPPPETAAAGTPEPVLNPETPEPSPIPETPEPTRIPETPEPAATAAAAPEPVRRLAAVAYPGNPDLKIDNRFRYLRAESKYITGWLNIDRLIDEAVVQRDNIFYLNHDVYGSENVNGAVFLDAGTSLQTQPFAYLLYGHNMKTGEKFGCLRNYENTSFYHSNPFISFETIYESGRYVIFSVGNISTDENDPNYADLYALIHPEIDARQEAIDALKKASLYNCTVDVQPEDQFLPLITCVASDAERRVVSARRVRAGENEEELRNQIRLSVK